MEARESSKEQHVAVLAFPFGSHDRTIFGLTYRLACEAPKVQFSFFSTSKSNQTMFSTDVPTNLKAYNVDDGVPMNGHVCMEERLELFLKTIPANFKMVLDVAMSESVRKISCIITDMFLTFAADVAKSMKACWIPLCVAVPYNLSAHVYTSHIRSLYRQTQTQTLEAIPGLSGIYITDLSDEILLPKGSKETMFSHTLSKIASVLPEAAAIIVNFNQELYPEQLLDDLNSMFPNLLNVGFLTLHLPPPSDSIATVDCLSWLDKQRPKSVVYVGFGTVAIPPNDELKALAEALEETQIPFLWSLNQNYKNRLPDGFVERTRTRGKIVSWAPQTQVLGHPSTAVFVTHSGANSVFESIANGVPMICRPMFGDHRVNAHLVQQIWGVGVTLMALTKTGLINTMDLIFGREEAGNKMRHRITALRDLVLKASEPTGSASLHMKTLLQIILNS